MPYLSLVTAPSVEPITLAEAKLHAKIETTDDDTLITNLIVAARRAAETFCGRAFISQVWDAVYDELPGEEYPFPDALVLPRLPLVSVTGAYYTGTDGTETTWAATNYQVDLISGRLIPLQSWPSRRERSGFRVRWTAGYASAAAVPQEIKQALLEAVTHFYEKRADGELPMASKRLLQGFRSWLH